MLMVRCGNAEDIFIILKGALNSFKHKKRVMDVKASTMSFKT